MLAAASLLVALGWSAPAPAAPPPQWIGGFGLAPRAAGGALAMGRGCPRDFYQRAGTTLLQKERADGARRHARARLGSDGYALLAAGPGGAVGVAWIELHGEDRYVLRAAVRPPGGPLSEPVAIARRAVLPELGGGVSDAAIAFLPDGRLLVAFAEPYAVKATVVAPGGARGPVVRLGPASEFSRVRAAVSRSGRAVVAWGTQDAGEERNLPYELYVAIREPGATGFRARRLERAGAIADPTGDPELAIAPDGRAALEWHDSLRLQLAVAAPGRPFTRGRVLARGGIPGGVAVRDDGLVLATWVAGHRVRAQLGSGPPATVSWDVGFLPDPPRAAFDARGRPRVQWGDYVVTGG